MLIRRYVGAVLKTKAKTTQKNYLYSLKLLEQAFGHMRPSAIKPIHMTQYRRARGHNVAANRDVAALSAVLQFALEEDGSVSVNVARQVKRLPEHPRTRYVTDAEFNAVLDQATPSVRCAMKLSYLTGQRLGDVLALSKSDLSAEGIAFTQSKTGKKLIVLWNDELREVVAECKALPSRLLSTHLIVTRDGRRYSVDGFKSIWQRLMSKYVAGGGERFTFHDLRAKSAEDHESGAHLGHGDTQTLQRVYRNRKPKRVAGVSNFGAKAVRR